MLVSLLLILYGRVVGVLPHCLSAGCDASVHVEQVGGIQTPECPEDMPSAALMASRIGCSSCASILAPLRRRCPHFHTIRDARFDERADAIGAFVAVSRWGFLGTCFHKSLRN
jgi:hypothetical protein